MPHDKPAGHVYKTGGKPTERHVLAAATAFRPVQTLLGVPPQWIWIPQQLSYWNNDYDGCCVTSEECFAKACSGVFISDQVAHDWANRHGVLNGAYLNEVLDWMTYDGFGQDGNSYRDGHKVTVNWTNVGELQNAIYQGPVKIGVASGQLQNVVQGKNGWLAQRFSRDRQQDHCVSLCGFGAIGWLLEQLGQPNSGDTSLGWAMFTWDTIGVIDHASMLAITGEAWLRSPTTTIVGSYPPTPDVVVTPDNPFVPVLPTSFEVPGVYVGLSGSDNHIIGEWVLDPSFGTPPTIPEVPGLIIGIRSKTDRTELNRYRVASA